MSEDFPGGEQPIKPEEQLAEVAIGQVEDAEPNRIEVQDATTDNISDDGRVDESKAWDMAHAAIEERNTAHWAKAGASHSEAIRDKAPEIAEKLQEAYEPNYQKRVEVHKKITELVPEVERLDIPRDEWTDELRKEVVSKKTELQEAERERKVLNREMEERGWEIAAPYYADGPSYGNTNPVRDSLRNISNAKSEYPYRLEPEYAEPTYFSQEAREKFVAGQNERTRREYVQKAAAAEKQAERLETWAGILHDNPPTEAFKQKYGNRLTTPSVLVSIEGKINREEAFKQQYEPKFEAALQSPSILISDSEAQLALKELMYDRDEGMGLDTHRRSVPLAPHEVMTEVYGKDSDELTEWHRMQLDPNTTLGQLHEKYATALREAVKPFLYESDLHKAFLDDIRSGRAAQWQ